MSTPILSLMSTQSNISSASSCIGSANGIQVINRVLSFCYSILLQHCSLHEVGWSVRRVSGGLHGRQNGLLSCEGKGGSRLPPLKISSKAPTSGWLSEVKRWLDSRILHMCTDEGVRFCGFSLKTKSVLARGSKAVTLVPIRQNLMPLNSS